MKELEKTKRISIAAVLFILVIIIGFVTVKRPKHVYSITAQTATKNIAANNFLISLKDLPNDNSTIIDIRNQFEYDKGHIENAINIQASDILNDENIAYFSSLKNKNTTVILYGTNPNEALAPYMVLQQLGYHNFKILTIENSYKNNKLVTKNIEVEKQAPDINDFIENSIKKSNVKLKPTIQKAPKKVILIKKKKKATTEGGC